jgi:hypothetical protein
MARKLAALVVLLSFTLGCGNMRDRHPPSGSAFISTYLKYFDASQIRKLDSAGHGAIGGMSVVGRAEFTGPIRLNKALIDEQVKKGLIKERFYDPAEMTKEPAAMNFRQQWEVHAGGTLPSWFDFPYNRKLRTITERDEGHGGDHPTPRYENIWYIDDQRNVVYVRGNWG